jgi:hypothetical protein
VTTWETVTSGVLVAAILGAGTYARAWWNRRRERRREDLKRRIVQAITRATTNHSGRSVDLSWIARNGEVDLAELLPLLEELVAAKRVFPGPLAGTYTLSPWRPDPGRLYGR